MVGMREKLFHFLNLQKEISKVTKTQHNDICFEEILIMI